MKLEEKFVNKKLDKIDQDIKAGRRKLLNSNQALGKYAKHQERNNLKERNIWDTAFKSGYNEAVKDNGKKVAELKKRIELTYRNRISKTREDKHTLNVMRKLHKELKMDFEEVFGEVKP